jgi:hypothetical protein
VLAGAVSASLWFLMRHRLQEMWHAMGSGADSSSTNASFLVHHEPPSSVNSDPPPVKWPRMRLSGIAAVPGGVGSAVINGHIVMEGETVEGVVLETVTRTGIVLRAGAQTRFVSENDIASAGEERPVTNAPPARVQAPAPTGFRGLLHRWFGW